MSRLVSLDPPSKNKTNALLLTTNTEVSIAPKLRRGHSPSPDTQSPSKSQSNGLGASSSSAPKSKVKPYILRVLPARVLVSLPPITNYPEIIAYVSPQTLSQIIQPHSVSDGVDKPNKNKYHRFNMKRLTPPTDPLPLSSTSAPPPTPPTPRILNPHTNGNVTSKPKEQESNGGDIPIYIGILGIPNSHIVFPSGVEGVGMHLEEWDLVK